jgi:hypothetical protein
MIYKPKNEISAAHSIINFIYLDLISLSKKVKSDNPTYKVIITTLTPIFPKNNESDENNVTHRIGKTLSDCPWSSDNFGQA